MFLDLADSTTLAEELGDLRFSAFLRDFMGALTEPVLATKASIHTYIGDGVVLSWPGGKVHESLRFHHLLQASIERNTSFYRERYGEAPRYRLGLHIGEVVVTEIGELKSDIVLHGDAVNTTSRIQTMCRPLGFQVLASQEWIAAIADSSSWRDLGEHPLKGKIHPVRLFTPA
jgi:adenylate cyclase